MFKINLMPWDKFTASSIDEAILTIKKNCSRSHYKAIQVAIIKTEKAPLVFTVIGKKKISQNDIMRCLDNAKTEWKSCRIVAIDKAMKDQKLIKALRAKNVITESVANFCALSQIAISLDGSTPSISYSYYIYDTALKGVSITVSHCPYGKYDGAKSSIRIGSIDSSDAQAAQQQAMLNQQIINQNFMDQMNRDADRANQQAIQVAQQNQMQNMMFF